MATLTSRLGGIFRKMRLHQPASIDLHDAEPKAQALRRLSDDELDDMPTDIDPERTGDARARNASGGGGFLDKLPGRKRDAAIAQLQSDYGEVIGLVRDVRHHLDSQSDRSERLLELLADLPEALQAIPESNRNQSRMLEALNTHLETSHRSAAELNGAVRTLAGATEHQSQTLGVLQEQIHASRETDDQMLASFGAMSQTLQNLNDTSRQSSSTLRAVTEQTASSEQRLQDLIAKNGRQMFWLSAISWTLAAVALGLAVYVAITSSAG